MKLPATLAQEMSAMRSLRLHRALVPAALSAALLAAAPRPFVQGWKFTWQVTSARSDSSATGQARGRRPSGDAQADAAFRPSMHVEAIPGFLRIDFDPTATAGAASPRGYMLLDANGRKFTMVNTVEKKAVVMDPSGIGDALGGLGKTGLVKMDITDYTVNVEDLGAGDRILGHPTHRYRISRSYSAKVKIAFISRSSRNQSVSEVSLTPDFINDPAFQLFAEHFANRLQGSGSSMQQMIEANRKVPKGFPMRSVETATSTDDKGHASTSTTTSEVTELVRANLDAADFQVPPGYEVADLGATMADAGRKIDSAKADCEAKNGKGKCDMPNLDSAYASWKAECQKKNPADKCSMNMDDVKKMLADSAGAAKQGEKDKLKDVKKGLKGLFKKP
jgi:Domain of unknown function (DUF4412)